MKRVGLRGKRAAWSPRLSRRTVVLIATAVTHGCGTPPSLPEPEASDVHHVPVTEGHSQPYSPAQASNLTLGSPIESRVEAGTLTVVLPAEIYFPSGSAELLGSATETLDTLAEVIKARYAGQPVLVTGYSDSPAHRHATERNLVRLSQKRADAIKNGLVIRGVPDNTIIAKGVGSANPKATRAASRRVEIKIGPASGA